MTHFLAIDQSTSATKALLFDEVGRLLDKESREHQQHYPQPGWVEHDAEEIWLNTLQTLRTLLARHTNENIVSLSITNQRETVVIFDRATGQPLYPAIVWQCRRSVAICEEHAKHEALIQERTGLRLDAYFSASKIQWMIRQHPGLKAKLLAGEALIGTVDCYLIYRLTNGAVFATDHTNACRTLLFDIGRLCWDDDLCALFEVPMNALPEVRESSARFGEATMGAKTLPICGVMGDSQAALLAQRCFALGTAKVTFGTGSSILLNIGSERRQAPAGVVTTLAWVLNSTPTYAFEGIIISSAATLTWLRDQLGVLQDFAEIEPLARSVPDNEGVYLVPAFSGLGLPHWQPEARAAIVGLSAQSDRCHVIRAGVESIAYQLRDALDAMRGGNTIPLHSLHGDGGATINRFLMQFTADLNGVALCVATMSDCSPLGATFAGMLGMGVYDSFDALAALPQEDVVYQPAMPPQQAQRFYEGWQRAVRQTLQAMTMILLLALAFTSCKLWTIRPLESKAKNTAATAQIFSADSYVNSIWESKIVPLVTEKAIDLTPLLTALEANADEAKKQFGVREGEGATHFIVKGEGVISRIDNASPHRTLTIRLPKYAGKTEVTLQIGPVFRGTALRDAVGFIKFNEFTNQLHFAEVSTKLHERVFKTMGQGLEPASLPGKTVSFYGVFTLHEHQKIVLTPVQLKWGGAGK